ncbi:uncharacterized protein C17orf80 homolog isoform X2 [Octodon degus]|uniref:Uncharacterized protein C17orf80 homolog isoform X2 n=1 Tax=Octodon degus TaxID=10160 RepID=A0A6P3ER53_OCTDE|nr:uncharacterized protein C17orf80 homolog isoform X2 [Octodon degus]
MSDTQPKMELCPYCKKPFKRLKSHLPYCKMIGLSERTDQKIAQSKPATHLHAKKVKSLIRDLTEPKGREFKTKSEEKNAKLRRHKPEQTIASCPQSAVGLERASTTKAEKDIRDQTQLAFKMLKYPEPMITFQGEAKTQFYASNDNSKRGLAKDVPVSEEKKYDLSETEGLLLAGSVEPLLNQDRKYSSAVAVPNNVQAMSPNLKLDTVDSQRQGFLVKCLDKPTGDSHQSPRNVADRAQKVTVAVLSKQRDSRDRDRPSGVLAGVETQEENSESPVLGLHASPLAKIQVEKSKQNGLGLGVEGCGSKGDAECDRRATEMRQWDSVSHNSKNRSAGDSATEETLKAEGPLVNLFAPREAVYSEPPPVSKSPTPSLATLSMKSVQEAKADFCSQNQVSDVKIVRGSTEQGPTEPKSGCPPTALRSGGQQGAYPAQHHLPKSAFVDDFGATDRKTLPSGIGLEWFPELYSGYLGLGVLAGKPQYWPSVAQKPQLTSPQWGHLSQVPLLERSSADLRSLEPPTRLAPSSFPLMKLLGAVHKGWVRCNTTIKKSGVGSVTMLFAGYFMLCCSWSFRHLTHADRGEKQSKG